MMVKQAASCPCRPRGEVMICRVMTILISVMLTGTSANAQPDVYRPDAREVLRLIRNDKLDLILRGAMRDNNVDMWIHVARHGDPMHWNMNSEESTAI